MNIRKCTQRAESPVINSVGQRPAKRNGSCSQALKGRNQRDYAPLGLTGWNGIPTDRAMPYPDDYAFRANSEQFWAELRKIIINKF